MEERFWQRKYYEPFSYGLSLLIAFSIIITRLVVALMLDLRW